MLWRLNNFSLSDVNAYRTSFYDRRSNAKCFGDRPTASFRRSLSFDWKLNRVIVIQSVYFVMSYIAGIDFLRITQFVEAVNGFVSYLAALTACLASLCLYRATSAQSAATRRSPPYQVRQVVITMYCAMETTRYTYVVGALCFNIVPAA